MHSPMLEPTPVFDRFARRRLIRTTLISQSPAAAFSLFQFSLTNMTKLRLVEFLLLTS